MYVPSQAKKAVSDQSDLFVNECKVVHWTY